MTTLLWFDDDLQPVNGPSNGDRADLQRFLRPMKKGPWASRNHLLEAHDLPSLRQVLMRSAAAAPTSKDRIGAFLVDIGWRLRGGRTEETWNFGELDPVFSSVRVLPLDAGAQLLKLMLGEGSHQPPDWLSHHSKCRLAVLTSYADHRATLAAHISSARLQGIARIMKGGSDNVTRSEDQEILAWLTEISS